MGLAPLFFGISPNKMLSAVLECFLSYESFNAKLLQAPIVNSRHQWSTFLQSRLHDSQRFRAYQRFRYIGLLLNLMGPATSGTTQPPNIDPSLPLLAETLDSSSQAEAASVSDCRSLFLCEVRSKKAKILIIFCKEHFLL